MMNYEAIKLTQNGMIEWLKLAFCSVSFVFPVSILAKPLLLHARISSYFAKSRHHVVKSFDFFNLFFDKSNSVPLRLKMKIERLIADLAAISTSSATDFETSGRLFFFQLNSL